MADSGPLNASLRRPRPVLVLVLPGMHALDFAGPVQAVYEANGFGAEYHLHFVGERESVHTAQGFTMGRLEALPEVSGDAWILVPGTESSALEGLEVPVEWLRAAAGAGARVSSICSGAFALARAGLLEGRRCTTHWKVLEKLAAWSPGAEVLENRLFVRDGNIVTSAGLASGIDMALSLIEQDYGPRVAGSVAREMVVYLRREGEGAQQSVFLEHRAHLHAGVHRVQDWIVAHPDRHATLEDLAAIAALSPRHLTRVFRRSTGTTLKTFATKVRLETAGNLLRSGMAIDRIASRCGFEDARQLRRLWRHHFGHSMRDERTGSRAVRESITRNPRSER